MNRRSFLVRGTAAFGMAVPGRVFESTEAAAEVNHSSNAVGDGEVSSTAENFAAPAYVHSGTSGETKSWTIGNGFIERHIGQLLLRLRQPEPPDPAFAA
jgi:hypothetical protein